MRFAPISKWMAAAGLVALTGGLAAPAFAGPSELNLLTSYIGNWRGEGALHGAAGSGEPFRCRLSIAKGNQAKVNYAGRCTLVDMNLSVSGTIAYNDKARRYEAAMSSNAGFTGIAVGKINDGRITFDLAERETDRGGNMVRIGSKISLDKGQITVEFEVEFNNSGDVLTAKVPFAR